MYRSMSRKAEEYRTEKECKGNSERLRRKLPKTDYEQLDKTATGTA